MARPGWYMVAYDIANPKRLGKIHRLLKKRGLAVQKSVFLVNGDEKSMNRLLDQLAGIMNLKQDDIRAYPITHPKEVWTTGGPLETFPLIISRETPKSKPGQSPASKKYKKGGKTGKIKKQKWWRRFFS